MRYGHIKTTNSTEFEETLICNQSGLGNISNLSIILHDCKQIKHC